METLQALIEQLQSASEPWVVYNTMVDLRGDAADSSEVRAAYRALQNHPRVTALIDALEPWPATKPLSRAYDPKDAIWKLQTLADFGLRRDDKRIAAIAKRVFAVQAEDGAFLHGGFDHTRTWDTRPYICIAHVMTYALARFGYLDDPRLHKAYAQIEAWQRGDRGWHPNKNNLLGSKGEAEWSCPFGSENVLRALAANPETQDRSMARRAAEFLLSCWSRRAEPFRPVGFGIGSDWRKLQYPFVQYQLLKTVDVLAQLPAVRRDPRLHEMLAEIEAKPHAEGGWTADSISKAWSDFDFAQKKQASPWLTFLAVRAFMRTHAPSANLRAAKRKEKT